MPHSAQRSPAPLRLVPKLETAPVLTELEIDIRHFLIALRQKGRVPGTLEKYRLRLSGLALWLAQRGASRLDQLDRRLLREWGAALYDRPWQPATVRHATAVARSFLAWCYAERLTDDDLSQCLALPKSGRRVQRTIGAEDVEKLLTLCDLARPVGARNAAIVSLLFDTGLRASEICRVQADSLQFGVPLGDIRVNLLASPGKGDNWDLVPFGERTAALVHAWLKLRWALPGVSALFVAVRGSQFTGRAMTRWAIWRVVHSLGEKIGIEVGPHDFRRGMATAMTINGAPTRLTQLAGRWSDVRMVERYTRALEVARHYGAYSPVDHMGGK